MRTTLAYDAKRAIFALLDVQTAPGMALDGIQVAYSFPTRDTERKLIYGGGVRFIHTDEAGEWNTVVSEAVIVGVYIRVLLPGETVYAADVEVERLADVVTDLLTDSPKLAGTLTWIGTQQGNGDYSETPEGPESVLSLQVLVGGMLI